jgi:DNA-binding NarL/FixJ family response regulator
MKPIRILLVDDEEPVRRGLRMRLGLEPDFEVVGEATDGSNALEAARMLNPDVVLMDIRMAIENGLSATFDLHQHLPGMRVIMVSMQDDAATRQMARHAGADAFVAKHQDSDQLIAAIRGAA